MNSKVKLYVLIILIQNLLINSSVYSEIINDVESTFKLKHRYPETVALIYDSNRNIVKCSGTLISNYSLITAAHCVCQEQPISVYLGGNVFPALGEPRGHEQVKGIDSIQLYSTEFCKEFNQENGNPYNFGDIALVHTNAPFEAVYDDMYPKLAIDRHISGIMNKNTSFTLYGAGFGKGDNADYPGKKLKFSVKAAFCTRESANQAGCIYGKELLTIDDTDTDTCHGDSGGPVYILVGNQMMFVAITSRARSDADLICGDGGIFTLLIDKDINAWINTNKR